ncbi:MAG: type II toxin-antitoxin system HicB family antitoxin [Chloroflexi bacterium]|nr:type II toxin-antitoxin system HicB family antitoxin [Chloroflexota bacterium]
MKKVRMFRLSEYVEAALKLAEYERDEDGGVVAQVPNASGFFSQGDTFEEARENLRDAIEGVVILALQLGWQVPEIEGVTIEERDAETLPA